MGPLAVVTVVAVGVTVYKLWGYYKEQESNNEYSAINLLTYNHKDYTRYSNPNNNHDDQKQPHASRNEAEIEAARMQCNNPHDNFNAYFNKERSSWYVGRSRF